MFIVYFFSGSSQNAQWHAFALDFLSGLSEDEWRRVLDVRSREVCGHTIAGKEGCDRGQILCDRILLPGGGFAVNVVISLRMVVGALKDFRKGHGGLAAALAALVT